MLQIKSKYFQNNDDRGTIEGLINTGIWREINKVSSAAATVRGRHYHKKIQAPFIILHGKVEILLEKIETDAVVSTEQRKIQTSDAFIIGSYIQHMFTRRDTEWLNILSEPFDTNNPRFF